MSLLMKQNNKFKKHVISVSMTLRSVMTLFGYMNASMTYGKLELKMTNLHFYIWRMKVHKLQLKL